MDRLNYKKTALLGLGLFAITVCTSLYASYVPAFLDDYLDKAGQIGFLMTLDSYIGLFLQPVVGRLSDGTRTRFGRRIPFILVGMPLAAAFFCLIPNHRSLPGLVVPIVLYNVSLSVFRAPAISLMPDLTPARHRSKANGVVNLMGGIGAAAAFLAGSYLFELNASYPFYMAGVLLLVSMAALFAGIREKRDSLVGLEPVPAERIKLLPSLKGMKKVLPLLVSVFFLYAAFNAVAAFFTLYGQKYLATDVSEASRKMTFFALSMIAAALPAGFLGSKLGKKKTMVLGLCLLLAVFTAVIFVRRLDVIGWLLIAGGAAWALVIINAYPFVVSMAETKNAGAYTGIYYLFTSLSAVVSPPLAGTLIDSFGYGILFLYAAVMFVLALVFLLAVKAPGRENADTP